MIVREHWLKDLYDPNGTLPSVEDALIERDDVLHDTVVLDQTPSNEVVAAEVAHVGIELSEPRVRALGITTLRAVEIVQSVETTVAENVTAVLSAVDELKKHYPKAAQQPDIILAGMISAEWAHLGVKRKNGKDYYTHPASVAEVLEMAWRRNVPANHNPERLERLLFIAYNHDAFEDSLPTDNTSFLAQSSFLVSPLFVQRLFEKLGRSDGEAAGESILLLSKTQHDSAKSSLDRYTWNVATDEDATLIKLADIQHNARLDPKGLTDIERIDVAKNRKRADDYSYVQSLLLAELEKSTSTDLWIGHTITAITAHDFITNGNSLLSIRPKPFIGTPPQKAR